jgi:hypothetical protein
MLMAVCVEEDWRSLKSLMGLPIRAIEDFEPPSDKFSNRRHTKPRTQQTDQLFDGETSLFTQDCELRDRFLEIG